MIEFVIGYLTKLSELGCVLATISGLSLITLIMFESFESDKQNVNTKHYIKLSLITFFISLPLICFPSMDDIWKIRIALIKYELTSPENIKKGTEIVESVIKDSLGTVERIGKKLECKYVGCDEDKK